MHIYVIYTHMYMLKFCIIYRYMELKSLEVLDLDNYIWV